MKSIEEYIKNCREKGFPDKLIRDKLLFNNYPSDVVNNIFFRLNLKRNLELGIFFSIVVVFVIGFLVNSPTPTGYVTIESEESYSDNVGLIMNESSYEGKDSHRESVKGIVTARKCECCGHHEIGVTSQTGEYISLKPGMMVKIFRAADEQ